MAIKELSGFQKRLISFWVNMRTSFAYLWGFISFCILWVICNKSQILPTYLHWDNQELTYLNLLLSILAEVSAITILVYTLRLSDQNNESDKKLINDILEIKNSIEKHKQPSEEP